MIKAKVKEEKNKRKLTHLNQHAIQFMCFLEEECKIKERKKTT